MARMLSLTCLSVVSAVALTLYWSGCRTGLDHKARGVAGVRRFQQRFITSLKEEGFILDAWAEGESLAVVPGPRWHTTDQGQLDSYLGRVAEALCGDSKAPVKIRERRP